MCEEQMVRGGKVSSKKNFRNRFRPKDKGSDDSDEDYVVSNEENGVTDCSDDDYCSSLDGCVSGEDREEVVEERRKKTRKTVGPKARNRNGLGTHKVRQRNERKRRRLSYEEEEEEEEEEDDDGDEDYKVDDDNDYEEEVEVEEEEEDYVVEEEEEEEVEEEDFTPEEEEFSDEEQLFVRTRGNNMKLGPKAVRKRTSRKVSKRKKPKAAKKPSRNAGRRNHGWRNVRISDDDEFSDNDHIVANTRSKRPVPKRKRCVTRSDLDILLSGSSDYEFTISEEEREQVREAERLCGSGSLNTRARSITSPQKTELNLRRLRKPPVRKGKEKLDEVKAEVVKQVCGICLSEEDKRRVRGTLNCCSHFFCFSCIMEWAKVESRCPLCKQRFQTISKPARSAAGIDLREVVIQVPERDQVYQPSEEELRSYLDPYENVICTECHEGGDDNLMLLCDLCDSPAHTYCVGLGREVPVGSWYCVDCRTNSMGSSSSQASGRLFDRRTFNNLFNRPIPVVSREGLDLNSLSSPRTPNSQGFSNVASPRFPVEVQSSSPISQAAAPTIVGRRIIRLHISQIRSSNQMGGFVNNRTDGVSTANISGSILNSQIARARETAFEHVRPREMALPSQTSLFGEGLHENPSPLMQHEDFLDSESSHLSRQAIQDPQISMSTNITGNRTILNPLQRLAVENTTMTVDRNVNGALWPEHGGVNSLSNCEQIYHHHSVLNTVTDDGLPPPVRDGKDYCEAREQLQPIIESHLKNLSRDIDLGQSTSADIATKATCTILAACGFENLINEAYQASPPSHCPHNIEMSMGESRRSLIKGICSSCFDAYVEDVVKKITDASLSSWLSLTL